MNETTDEWRGEEDGIEVAIRVTYDDYGIARVHKEFLEEVMTRAGLYKYEENI